MVRYNVIPRSRMPASAPLDDPKKRRMVELNLEMSDPEFRKLAVAIREGDMLKAEALKMKLRPKYSGLDRIVEDMKGRK